MSTTGAENAAAPRKRWRPRLLLVAVTPFVLLQGWAAGPPTKTVDIAKFAFTPREITVEPGTRVRWTNHDEAPHTVTSQTAGKVFSSPGMDFDDAFDFVFTAEGDYGYLCTVHPMMTGVVHVRNAASKGR